MTVQTKSVALTAYLLIHLLYLHVTYIQYRERNFKYAHRVTFLTRADKVILIVY